MTRSGLHWNSAEESLSGQDLETWEDGLLLRQLEYVSQRSPFYRELWTGHSPNAIRTRQELRRLPFTTKDDLRQSQVEYGGLGGHQCAADTSIVRIQGTSGTTGRPLYIGLTARDADAWAELFARHAWVGGLRPGDRFINPANFTLFVGGLSEAVSAERMGVGVVPAPFASTGLDKWLQILRDTRPNILFATPSSTWFIEDMVRAKLGMEPSALGFTKGFMAGEPLVEEDRRHIEATWGIDARNYYGMADVAADLAAECEAKNGMHFVGQGYVLPELISPDSGEPIDWEDGARGEIVYTTIRREATPVVRYRTRDVVEVVTRPCTCGRSSFRLRIVGRSDDMLKVRGINVFPSAVKEVISSFIPRTTGEMRIVLERPGHIISERLRIRAEFGDNVSADQAQMLGRELEERIKDRLGFRPLVEMVPPSTLPRTQYKVQYFDHAYAQAP